MLVLDAAPLVSLLLGEPGAAVTAQLVDEHIETAVMSVSNYGEVLDRVARHTSTPVDEVVDAIAWWVAGGMTILPLDETTIRSAASLRAQYYHRTTAPLSLADCVALAVTHASDGSLATSDRALIATARILGVDALPLPDSTGTIPA